MRVRERSNAATGVLNKAIVFFSLIRELIFDGG